MRDVLLMLAIAGLFLCVMSGGDDVYCNSINPIAIHPKDEFYCDVVNDRGTDSPDDDLMDCPTRNQIHWHNYDYEQKCETE